MRFILYFLFSYQLFIHMVVLIVISPWKLISNWLKLMDLLSLLVEGNF